MSEDNTPVDDLGQGSEGGSQDDPIQNFKAEVGRKFENLTGQLRQQAARNEQMLSQLAAMIPQQKQQSDGGAEDEDLSELIYNNPAEYTRRVQAEATQAATRSVQEANRIEKEKTETLGRLVSTYPELSDSNSELTKKAMEVYSTFSSDQQKTAAAYELAVARAVAEVGVLPASKRQAAPDPSLRGGSSTGGSKRSLGDIPDGTAQMAELMGLDLSNKDTKERLKKLSGLKPSDWIGYKRRV